MELDTIFNTQLASIATTVLAPFTLYRLLVSQKDSVIQLLKERLEAATAKIKDLESSSPDQLLQALDSRVGILNKELERMRADSPHDADGYRLTRGGAFNDSHKSLQDNDSAERH